MTGEENLSTQADREASPAGNKPGGVYFVDNPPRPLAQPDNGKSPDRLELMRASIDEGAVEVVDELDRLVHAIEEIKATVIKNAALVKSELERHYAFAGEAMGFRKHVHERLQEIGLRPDPT